MNQINHASKQKDLIYDVGMHKGEDTGYYLKKGFHVIGFEADPDLAAFCRKKFPEEIRSGMLKIVEGAILELADGETAGKTIKFYKNKDISVWGTVASNWARRNELLGTSSEIIDVPVVDFVEHLKKYGMPHYLKIDIEGMDTVCLKALLQFEERPDYISIESEKVSFDKLVEELNLLTQLGYTRFKAVQQSGISRLTEPRSSKEGRYVGYRFQEGSSGLFGEDLPGEWKDRKQTLDTYKFIFLQYKLFGDSGKLRKFLLGRVFIRSLSMLLRKPIPGWYDTHAKHSSLLS